MSTRTKKVLSVIFLALPALVVLLSATMKLLENATIVDSLSRVGFGPYVRLLGIAELIYLALLLYPKTYKVGLFLLTAHLGGATATQIAEHQPPFGFVLIALFWSSAFLKDRSTFFQQ